MDSLAISKDVMPSISKIISDAEIQIMKLTCRPVKLEVDFLGGYFLSQYEIITTSLQNEVCLTFGISWKDVLSKKRNAEFVDARRAYVYLAFEFIKNEYHFKITYKRIGREMNRHHTSIMHLHNTAKNFMKNNDPIKEKIFYILKKVYENSN